jgi:putative oxidoreductase
MEKLSLFFEKNQDCAMAFVRIFLGILMIYHGKEVFDDTLITEYSHWDQFKNFSNPKMIAGIGKGAELLAGLLLVVGFYTRIGAFMLIMSMLYITFFVGNGQFWYGDQHPFLFVLLGIVYLFAGGGRFSMDKHFSEK